MTVFSDRVLKFVRARNGRAHYGACRDALFALEPELASPDFEELCAFVRLRLRRRALLVVLTSLDDPVLAEDFLKGLALIQRQHLVLVGMIRPPRARPIFHAPVQQTREIYDRLAGHLAWQRLAELDKALERRGARFALFDDARLSAELVSRYLEIKQRQLL